MLCSDSEHNIAGPEVRPLVRAWGLKDAKALSLCAWGVAGGGGGGPGRGGEMHKTGRSFSGQAFPILLLLSPSVHEPLYCPIFPF